MNNIDRSGPGSDEYKRMIGKYEAPGVSAAFLSLVTSLFDMSCFFGAPIAFGFWMHSLPAGLFLLCMNIIISRFWVARS